jgi:hypothetical protein
VASNVLKETAASSSDPEDHNLNLELKISSWVLIEVLNKSSSVFLTTTYRTGKLTHDIKTDLIKIKVCNF